MEKLKFIIHVLKESWKSINHDRIEAARRLSIVKNCRDHLNKIYKSLDDFNWGFYKILNLIKSGSFKTMLGDISNCFEFSCVSVFDDNGGFGLKYGTAADEYFGKEEFSPYIMHGGIIKELDYCITKCNRAIEDIESKMKTRKYQEVTKVYEDCKTVLKKEEDFLGLNVYGLICEFEKESEEKEQD